MAAIDNLNVIIVIGGTVVVGQREENVLGIRVTTPGGGLTTLQTETVVQAYMKTAYGLINPDVNGGVIYDDITVYNRTQNTLIGTFSWDTSGGWGPTGTGDPLPPGVAPVITFPTNVSRRRGRKFLMGYGENASGPGALWTTSVMGRLTNYGAYLLGNQIITAVSGVSMQYGVIHEGSLGTFTFTAPTSAQPGSVPGYQRRRKQGVGV